MNTKRTAHALSTLTDTDGHLVGSVENALRLLGSYEVRMAFERLCQELDAGVLHPDEVHLQIVDEAFGVRVAVARRWHKAGASPRERQEAEKVDRALAPYQAALLALDDFEDHEDWLETLWVVDCIDIDTKSWWGWPMSQSWYEAGEVIEKAFAEAQRALLPQDRHEVAWQEYVWDGPQCSAYWCSRTAIRGEFCTAHEWEGVWWDEAYDWDYVHIELWETWAKNQGLRLVS